MASASFKRKFLLGTVEFACPSGMIAWFKLNSPPPGWVVCDGTKGTPNLIGKYPIGATSNIGTRVDQNLPNLTGEVSSIVAHGITWTGVFWKANGATWDNYDNSGDDAAHRGDTAPRKRLTFNANNFATPVNGNSEYRTYGHYGVNSEYYNKVIPESVRLLPCMKI